jgi:hypothetical protein
MLAQAIRGRFIFMAWLSFQVSLVPVEMQVLLRAFALEGIFDYPP